MGDRLRYTTTIVVSVEVLAGAFLELVSAMAKATPLVMDRIVEMCQKWRLAFFQKQGASNFNNSKVIDRLLHQN